MLKINTRQAIPIGIFIFSFILFSVKTFSFLTFNNMLSIFGLLTYTAVPAAGLATVMLTGLFDLSFVGVIGVLSTLLLVCLEAGIPAVFCLLITLIAALVMESVNAVLIIRLKIHPWLSTIATMLIYLGLEKYISKGSYLTSKHPILAAMRFNSFFEISLSIWIMLFFCILAAIVMNTTVLGKRLYAVGGNVATAQKAGVNTDAYKAVSFMIMGVLCWAASLIYVAQLSGYPPEAAYINQNEVILAVFVGMAISRRGIVNIHGALFGAAFVGILANGLGLMGVSSYWIKLVEGALVVIVVLGNSIKRGLLVQLE
ncbi:MAG: ABC transporter permease [Treponema sp.]|jgi:ribose transport system permease protein|nr:ABC transporter permease [Treponema sp.]